MILKGRSAVITGSSGGIGKALALAFAEQGASVVINARGAAAVEETVAQIVARGGEAIGCVGAVDDFGTAGRIVDACMSAFGGIDILVNNAGIFDAESIGPVDACSPEAWRRTVSVNLDGTYAMCHAALPHMKRQRRGRILNAGSLAGLGTMGGSAYSASKAAIAGLSRAMAADYGPWGITVNAYNPEAATDMGASNDPAVFAVWMDHLVDRGFRTRAQCDYTLGVCPPDGIAAILAYLCSDAAAHINGEIVAVEGRRIALHSWPEEQAVLFHDYARNGPLTVADVERLAPLMLRSASRWPQRSEEQLRRWEDLSQQ